VTEVRKAEICQGETEINSGLRLFPERLHNIKIVQVQQKTKPGQ